MTHSTGKGLDGREYVLVSAAYNEEGYIEQALSSIVRQTILPKRWIIVSDGSTDRTDAIVAAYAAQYDFIHLHRITERHDRNFGAQANAINTGFAQLREVHHDYIGNLDADISLEPTYFARLFENFERDAELGLAGGFIYERRGGEFKPRRSNSVESVAHGVQTFRSACLHALGGYLPLPYGGPDWHAEITARKAGWRVHAFPELKCYHHRPTGSASGVLRYCFRQGLMDFSLGSDPVFEGFKLARRVAVRPYMIGATARLLGFILAWARGEKRPVSEEFVVFLRNEQRARLRRLLLGEM